MNLVCIDFCRKRFSQSDAEKWLVANGYDPTNPEIDMINYRWHCYYQMDPNDNDIDKNPMYVKVPSSHKGVYLCYYHSEAEEYSIIN